MPSGVCLNRKICWDNHREIEKSSEILILNSTLPTIMAFSKGENLCFSQNGISQTSKV